MAVRNGRQRSFVAGATFSSGDLAKFVVVNANGHVVLPNTTGNINPLGTLAGRTSTTSSTGSESVPVWVEGQIPVRMAASTLTMGQWVGSSTAGLGIAPTTDAYAVGMITDGTSGAVNRIVTVEFTRGAPLSAV